MRCGYREQELQRAYGNRHGLGEGRVLGALAHVDYIEDNDRRNAFKGAVLRQWALDDPEALLAYVLDLSADEQDEAMRNGTLYAPLSALEPLRALEAAEALAGAAAAMVRRTALMQLAADDPLGALRHVESLPLGAERQQILSTIAMTYGRLDPRPPSRGRKAKTRRSCFRAC